MTDPDVVPDIDRLVAEQVTLKEKLRVVADALGAEQAECEAQRQRAEDAEAALQKINAIRDSIVSTQTVNWSEHVYPLVAALNEAGFKGKPYPADREYLGSLIEQRNALEVERDSLRAQLTEMSLERDRWEVEAEQWRTKYERAEADAKAATARVADIEARTKWEANGAPMKDERVAPVGADGWCEDGT